MKIIKTKVYEFKELPEDIQEKVIERYYDLNIDYEWWNCTLDQAKEDAGIDIREFDIYRNEIGGKLIEGIEKSIKLIIANHGKTCETRKLAEEYQQKIIELKTKYPKKNNNTNEGYNQADSYMNELEELEKEYKHDLLEEYLVMLRKEEEYLTSKEAIIETIEANEYTFTIEGKMFN